MPADSTDATTRSLRFDRPAGTRLLHWYQTERRDLPWRRTRDPYRILVAEIMLQQTRVQTVVPRYERFLERFPDLPTLAASAVEDVLAEWSGLGYYRRARYLHAAARAIVDEHRGVFPRDYAALRALPGLGAYTAAAVAAIAFGEPHVGLDGNVNRVLCRYFGIAEDPTRAAVHRRLAAAAESLLEDHAPGEVTQALMELGARVCLPRSPGCTGCPLARRCVAAAEGTQELLPARRKLRIRGVTEQAGVIERGGRFLLLRGQRPGVLADMWEFPTRDSRLRRQVAGERPGDRGAELRRYLADLGQRSVRLRRLGEIRHGITNRRIVCTVYRAHTGPPAAATARAVEAAGASAAPASDAPATPDATPRGAAAHQDPVRGWFTVAEAARLPLAASAKRIFELLGPDA